MLPSLLARDIQQGLEQFLITGFEPSDDFLHGLVTRFVQEPSGWLKGPYLQVGLPFTPGTAGRGFFQDFETQFPGHSHQEAAWQRLSSQHEAASTLVATGVIFRRRLHQISEVDCTAREAISIAIQGSSFLPSGRNSPLGETCR